MGWARRKHEVDGVFAVGLPPETAVRSAVHEWRHFVHEALDRTEPTVDDMGRKIPLLVVRSFSPYTSASRLRDAYVRRTYNRLRCASRPPDATLKV